MYKRGRKILNERIRTSDLRIKRNVARHSSYTFLELNINYNSTRFGKIWLAIKKIFFYKTIKKISSNYNHS